MDKYYFRKYKATDAILFKFRDTEEVMNILKSCPEYFWTIENYESYTVIKKEGKKETPILIIFWVVDLLQNKEIGMFACENLDEIFSHRVLEIIKDILQMALIGTKRLQVTCIENDKYKRFLEFLGFKFECKLRKYGFESEDLSIFSLTQNI